MAPAGEAAMIAPTGGLASPWRHYGCSTLGWRDGPLARGRCAIARREDRPRYRTFSSTQPIKQKHAWCHPGAWHRFGHRPSDHPPWPLGPTRRCGRGRDTDMGGLACFYRRRPAIRAI